MVGDGAKYAVEVLAGAFEDLLGGAFGERTRLLSAFDVISFYPDGHDNQFYMLELFRVALSELDLAAIGPSAKERNSEKLTKLRAQFQRGLNNNTWQGFVQSFDLRSSREALTDIAELMETSKLPRRPSLNRDAIARDINRVLDQLGGSGLPVPAQEVAKLKLDALSRLITATYPVSDEDISLKLKGIIADFNAAFEEIDGVKESFRQQVLDLGRKTGYAGAFALGLVVDGVALSGFIENHTSSFQIECGTIQGDND
jgi:hypothetical protein